MITPQDPVDSEKLDPLDDTSYGTFNPDMRLQARIVALNAAVRSLAGTHDGRVAAEVTSEAEHYERWLLRGERPTA